MAVNVLTIIILAVFAGLLDVTPGWGFTVVPSQERIAGLQAGVDELQDARRLFGPHDVALPGLATPFAGGSHASTAYRWTGGDTLGGPGLIVETNIGSSVISAVMIDGYPGFRTSRGLTVLVGEEVPVALYGYPDFAFDWRLDNQKFRELYYLNEGLVVVLEMVKGRTNWTVTKVILTSPTYLGNAVAARVRLAQHTPGIEDISRSYRVWAQMAFPPYDSSAQREESR
ncbi:MAG: hypothetical protein ACYDBB_00270 [Armatimonadota bacterium]